MPEDFVPNGPGEDHGPSFMQVTVFYVTSSKTCAHINFRIYSLSNTDPARIKLINQYMTRFAF